MDSLKMQEETLEELISLDLITVLHTSKTIGEQGEREKAEDEVPDETQILRRCHNQQLSRCVGTNWPIRGKWLSRALNRLRREYSVVN